VEELEAILNALPVDITFVDAEDRVRYFNQSEERIFPRTRAIIGRSVQQCHPQKSVDIVNRIVEEFRGGERDVAEFWINLEGVLVHIRYFPVRDRHGRYLGVVEVTQDIMPMRQLEGEKRLLDEANRGDV
jgi:PAS domain S-box-containing protein